MNRIKLGALALTLAVPALAGACAVTREPVAGSTETPVPVDLITIAADEGACFADYRNGAWDVCGITIPAPEEDFYAVAWSDGAWHFTLGEGYS